MVSLTDEQDQDTSSLQADAPGAILARLWFFLFWYKRSLTYPVLDRYRHHGLLIPGDFLEHFLALTTWDVPVVDNAAVITHARRYLDCACMAAVCHRALHIDAYAVDVWLCAGCGCWTCWIRPHTVAVFPEIAPRMSKLASAR